MSKPRPRVFLDSNVVFSGVHSPEGAPGIILEHFVKGSISVVVSQQVLEEVVRTIKAKLSQCSSCSKKTPGKHTSRSHGRSSTARDTALDE